MSPRFWHSSKNPARFRRTGLGGALALAGLMLFAGAASAQAINDGSFLVNKKFDPTNLTGGSGANVTQLTFDLFSTQQGNLTVNVTDTLPATTPAGQLWFDVGDTATVSGEAACTTGTITFSDFFDGAETQAQTITITGATLPPRDTVSAEETNCHITIPVHYGGVERDVTVINTVPAGDATATDAAGQQFESDPFSASLALRAPANPLVVSKSFTPAIVRGGATPTLTINVTNNVRPPATLTGVEFTDNLPTGLTANGAPTFSSACGPATSGTASGSTTVEMTGATIAAGAKCIVTVPVLAPDVNGPLDNVIAPGDVHDSAGHANELPANAILHVRNEIKILKVIQSGSWHTDTLPVPANLFGFTPSQSNASVGVNQPVPLRVYFSNPTGAPLTGGNLVDQLPNLVTNVGTAVSGNCTSLPANLTSNGATPPQITISGFSVPAANATTGAPGTCYVQFWVQATGTFTDNTNALQSDGSISFDGNPTIDHATSATMNATHTGDGTGTSGAVTLGKRFFDQTGRDVTGSNISQALRVNKAEPFWMRVMVNNNVYTGDFTGGSVTDLLPKGLKPSTNPPTVTLQQNPPTPFSNGTSYADGCTGGTLTTTANQGADSDQWSLTFSGWTLHSGAYPDNQTAKQQGCFYSIELVSDEAAAPGGGDYINTISARTVTTTEGVTNINGVAARVIVASDLETSKVFSPATIGPANGAVTRLTISFHNQSTAQAISNLAVTDPLPTSSTLGTLSVANPADVSNTCGGTVTATPGAASVTLAGGGLATGASCEIAVNVVRTVAAGHENASGKFTNTIAEGKVTNDQNQGNNAPVSADLTISTGAGIDLVKKFARSNALGGQPVALTLDFAAQGSSQVAQDLIHVTDNLPAGMQVAPVPNVSTTCVKADGSTAADVAVAADNESFTISGFHFDAYSDGAEPHNRCTMSVDVIMTVVGNRTNTIPTGAIGTSIYTTNLDPTQATITAQQNTAVLKSFEPNEIQVGASSTMTITVVNVGPARSNFQITDNLPTGMTVAAGDQASTCGGTINAPVNGTTVALTGGNVAANAQCTITVQVKVASEEEFLNCVASGGDADGDFDLSGACDTLTGKGILPPPTVAPIPTLGEWALVLLAMLIGGFGMLHWKRRHG